MVVVIVAIEESILTAGTAGTEPITVRITPIRVQINRNIRLMTSLEIQSKNVQTSVGIGLDGVYVAMRLQIWLTALPMLAIVDTALPEARVVTVKAVETTVETIALTIATTPATNPATVLIRVVKAPQAFPVIDVGIVQLVKLVKLDTWLRISVRQGQKHLLVAVIVSLLKPMATTIRHKTIAYFILKVINF